MKYIIDLPDETDHVNIVSMSDLGIINTLNVSVKMLESYAEPDRAQTGNDIHKADAGKAPISLVPPAIIWDIAEVRAYGLKKYPETGRDGWKEIGEERIMDAFLRHVLAMMNDINAIDEESGLPHRAHAACNLNFLCDMARDNE